MKVLIVDDNSSDRKILRYYIEQHGYEVIEASNGREGLRKASDSKPDLIISDALMPVMDGFQFLRNIKKDEKLKTIPFAFYSAVYRGDKDIELAMYLGAVAYIIKPKDPNEFWEELTPIIQERVTEKMLPEILAPEEEEYLRKYSQIVATKLEEKFSELQETLKQLENEKDALQKALEDQKKAEEALRLSEKKFRNLVETAPVGIIISTLDGVTIEVNSALLDIFGYDSREEFLAIPTEDLYLNPQDREHFIKMLNKEILQDFEVQFKHKDGSVFWGSLTSTHQFNEYEEIFITMIKDITEHKQAQEERQHLLKTLASKNEELESILYAGTHDLKSPIVNLQGFTVELGKSCQLLEKTLKKNDIIIEDKDLMFLVNKDIPDSLNFIQQNAVKINNLLDGLLKVSRISKKETNIESLDMNQLIEQIQRSMTYQINEKDVTFTVEELPSCYGDSLQIERVFTNLIDNALKYTNSDHTGRIRISGWIEDTMSIYCVEDNGIGIAPEHQSKIFELFHRLNPLGQVEGEGLGLTIAKRILQYQNGNIRVESEPGKGSRFFVTLPHSMSTNTVNALS